MTVQTLFVVAGALQRADGQWLMHRRPMEKHHGGLWEFPGGKVEPAEKPKEALARELSEELGIRVSSRDCAPLAFAQSDEDCAGPGIVILLYTISKWDGKPAALEGGAVAWFDLEAIATLEMPPLDRDLLGQLPRGS